MVKFELKDQKDKDGKVIDKIATITHTVERHETRSGTELRKRKDLLEREIEVRLLEINDLNEILGAMDGT